MCCLGNVIPGQLWTFLVLKYCKHQPRISCTSLGGPLPNNWSNKDAAMHMPNKGIFYQRVKMLMLRFWSWCLVEILIRKFDQDLCKNHSTLRSVVPLAMFLILRPIMNVLGQKHCKHQPRISCTSIGGPLPNNWSNKEAAMQMPNKGIFYNISSADLRSRISLWHHQTSAARKDLTLFFDREWKVSTRTHIALTGQKELLSAVTSN